MGYKVVKTMIQKTFEAYLINGLYFEASMAQFIEPLALLSEIKKRKFRYNSWPGATAFYPPEALPF